MCGRASISGVGAALRQGAVEGPARRLLAARGVGVQAGHGALHGWLSAQVKEQMTSAQAGICWPHDFSKTQKLSLGRPSSVFTDATQQ